MAKNNAMRGRRVRRARPVDPAQAAGARGRLEEEQVTKQPIILASRHNFHLALSFSISQAHDPILQLAKPILRSSSYSTFAGYANPLHIEPLFSCDASSLWSGAVAMYAVGRYGLIAKIPLMLGDSGGVSVLAEDHVEELAGWLESLPPPICSVSDCKGFKMQDAWYTATGQTYNFMGLPAEIRLHILELSFGYDIYPTRDNMIFGAGSSEGEFENAKRHAIRKIVPALEKNVLMLEKEMSVKMWEWTHKLTRKCFAIPLYFGQYLTALPKAKFRLDTLQILELQFTNQEYLCYFGVRVVPFRDHSDSTTDAPFLWQRAKVFKEIPSLKHLYLHFRAPMPDGRSDPWTRTGHLRANYGLDQQTSNGEFISSLHDWRGGYNGRTCHISCQRLLLGWILAYAVEYLKDIPKVTLCGWIKDDVRELWQRVLQDEINGIHSDLTEIKQVVENWWIEGL